MFLIVTEFKEKNNPIKHATEETAIEEARRLATKNSPKTFFVYELSRAYQVDIVREIEVVDEIPF